MNAAKADLNKDLESLIRSGASNDLTAFIQDLPQVEVIRSISRLNHEDQTTLFALLDPPEAREVIASLPEPAAVQVVENLTPAQAGSIVEGLRGDKNADLLGHLAEADATAILDTLTPTKAQEIRRLMTYPPHSAGGLMITEFLSFPDHYTVRDVLEDLYLKGDAYSDYNIQYAYVVSSGTKKKLIGVLRLRDLLLALRGRNITEVMITQPIFVNVQEPAEFLKRLFDTHNFLGLPVVDVQGELVGVVTRASVERHMAKQSGQVLLKIGGIVGGEEFRTMPLARRSSRRLSWLSLNVVLNIIAASIIALYQDTLVQVIALAVFLPIISDMSGCSGNQAIAVSLRELTLGLINPRELRRVILKESAVGIVNGIALGALLAGVSILWKGNPFLGLVVGSAMALNTILSACLGGVIPLILKRRKIDPALASGPILTTVTDMCGFFLVLSLATLFLGRLT